MTQVTVIESTRGFTTYTGLHHGTPVSIIATGMGTAMMDFIVREARAVTDGEMAMFRFGTCGGLGSTKAGAVVLAVDSVFVRREPGAFHGAGGEPFSTTQAIPANTQATSAYKKALEQHVGAVCHSSGPAAGQAYCVVEGTDVTCDSFYSSQGRVVDSFKDKNTSLLESIERKVPAAACAQMETFQLFDLALCGKPIIKAAAAALSMSNRADSSTVDMADFSALEMAGCHAALDALVATPLADCMTGDHCVWS
jgi:uridine phosphorylase